MRQILVVNASPRMADSASRSVGDALVARLRATYPAANVVHRDLTLEDVRHLDEVTLRAISTKDPAEAQALKYAARRSDQLTDELLESDLVVIATPMWNFGIPSALKAWIDMVVRPGRTFRYAGEGVEGLAKDTKAILVLASGGVFTDGPWRSWDFVEPYLRQILGFIGITEVQSVRAEGMNIPVLAPHAVSKAVRVVGDLAI